MEQSSPCLKNTIITRLWNSQQFQAAIATHSPTGLYEDFKQEVFLMICETKEDKLVELGQDVERYFLKAVFLFSKNFNSKDKKSRALNKKYFDKDLEGYARHLLNSNKKGFSDKSAALAAEFLNGKNLGSKEEKHKYEIFKMYVEFGSCKLVSEYYNVPLYHIKNVVSELRKDLKQLIKNGH
jgi:hypothetical protein